MTETGGRTPAGGSGFGTGRGGSGAAGTGAGLRAVGWVLPGLPRLLGGHRAGLPILGGWLFLWAVALLRAERVAATLSGGGADDWVALVTLLGGLIACWSAANTGLLEGWWTDDEETGDGGIGTPPAGPDPGSSPRGRAAPRGAVAWRRFARHRQAAAGLVLLAALCLSALLTPYLAPHDPSAQDRVVETRYQSPSAQHPLGTDRFGRDVLSRVLYGARISLGIGFVAVLIAITLGTVLGAGSGYLGGWADTVTMRSVDLLLSFPRLVLLITVVALFEPSIALVTVVLGLTGWMGTSRVVRGEVLSVREQPYVEAARALGYSDGRILFRHVLPNALGPVIVAATLGVGNTILAEAALSFLGLGVQPPTASWGNMVAAGRDVMLEAWWITLFPGLAIVLTVMSFNLVGDGLRDAMDPRHAAEGIA